VKALRSGLSQFILAAVLRSAALCMRLRNILRKWLVVRDYTFNSTHMSCNPMEFCADYP